MKEIFFLGVLTVAWSKNSAIVFAHLAYASATSNSEDIVVCPWRIIVSEPVVQRTCWRFLSSHGRRTRVL